jgi:DNA-directed RNA polymerase specialized sigma24 family protein
MATHEHFEELAAGLRSYATAMVGSHAKARTLVDEYLLRSSLDTSDGSIPAIRLTNRLVELVSEHSLVRAGQAELPTLDFIDIDSGQNGLTLVQARAVVEAIEAIGNDLCRAVLIWHWLGGVSAERIGVYLGCSKRAARRAVHQALRTLARKLEYSAIV